MSKLERMHLERRAKSLRKKAYIYSFSGLAPYYIVNEYPKSGGTWLSEMLSMAMELPFRRRGAIKLECAIVHGHFINPMGLRNVINMFRDPRDILVSFYYHCYFVNDRANEALVAKMKQAQPFEDYDDVRANLPQYIRFISNTPVTPRFSWPTFASVWIDRPETTLTTYEQLRSDTASELSRIIATVTSERVPAVRIDEVVEHFSFEKAKKRHEGKMRSSTQMPFIRAGSLGGWRAHFSPEAEAELEAQGFVEPMRKLGYDI